MIVYRVYLVEQTGGWREFGIDFPTREAADKAANNYRADWPRNRYIVRRVKTAGRVSEFVAV